MKNEQIGTGFYCVCVDVGGTSAYIAGTGLSAVS